MKSIDRRRFLFLLGTTAGTYTCKWLTPSALAATGPYTLPPLPYAYDALEPYIDKETMQFHHDRHHAAYINNLNSAVGKYPELRTKSVEELIVGLDRLPADIRATVRNNGGGHFNHTLFWQIMTPNGGGRPGPGVGRAIDAKFGDFPAFQTAFTRAGEKIFGSGWVWLVVNRSGELAVVTTANQDSPLGDGFKPILGNDVWEHAYYLKYRNQRGEYLKQWWNVVNWPEVERRYREARA